MTTTNEEIAEIQRRQADARGRVIDAACKSRDSMNSGHSTSDGEMAHVVEAAMMALVEVWRAEADWWESTTKRGRQGTAKEIRAAATRLAGFAVGLSTRPIGDVPGALQPLPPAAPDGGNGEVASITGSGDLPTPIITEVVAALPDGDPVATQLCDHPASAMSILKSGNARCTACGEDLPSPNFASLDAEPSPPVRASDGLFDDIATTEEQNLTAIIGPLGFGNAPATPAPVDNPFTSPAANPWRASARAATMVAFEHLPALAAKTPRREHVSHSFVETYEGCGLRSLLSDASRSGQLSPSKPGWSLVGGNAFHAAIQAVEQAAVAGQDLRPVGDELNAFWQHFLDAQVKTTIEEMGTHSYADPSTWHVANSGKEGYDWWRVEGARTVKLYLDHHDAAFRERVKTLMIGDTTPAIEAPYDMAIRSLDGQQGLPVRGFIDIARMDLSTYVVTINDYKTGAREPKSTFQLGEYAHALLFLMGLPAEPDPVTRPIMGSYWLARKGIYTTPIRAIATHPISELAYRYGTALGGHQAGVFAPNVSDFCVACGSRDYCPTQTGR